MAGVSRGNGSVWIGVFEGNGGDNGDNGEGAVRFSQMWAEVVSRAMRQRIQKTYCISSQAVQVSRRHRHPPESKGGSRDSSIFVIMIALRWLHLEMSQKELRF